MIDAFSLFPNHYKLAIVGTSELALRGCPQTGFKYFAVESSYAAKPPVGRGYDGLVRRNHSEEKA